ncbi:RHS repeat-associated core domain-containing protein [Desulfitibacter alkalitolerans]|uniref:RHS repeat-associated core domain-containing protein n=1 Tax=Desulfitibacter alkalitolerans TaxID=264641 RepID=UPI000481B041|nr:RHS repeat-associated core domain-containing protein [Desulfitibacter alkalitolerans]
MSTFGLPKYMINTAALGLYVTDRKFYHKGLGPAIDISFNYNSQAGSNSSFGYKWSFAYESYIELSENRVVLTRGSGQKLEFTMPEMSQHPIKTIPPEGRFDKLTDYGDYWLYQEKGSKELYRYDKVPGTVYSMLTAHMDTHGNAIMVHYNKDGTIKAITDAAGREIIFTYNAQGYCSSFSLPDGRRADFSYNDKGFMVKSINFEGIEADYQYDADGYMVQMIIGKGRRTTTFKYTERGSHKTISAVTDARGNTTTYEVTSLNPRIVKMVNSEGVITFFQSKDGLTERITDAEGSYSATSYEKGLPVSFRDKRGNITRYQYDPRGNLLSVTDPLNNVTRYGYDERDNLITETNAQGHSKTYIYDDKDNLVKIITPSGNESIFEYDEKGQLTRVKVEGSREVIFIHDKYGNVEKITSAQGATSTYNYLPDGYTRKSITDTMGNVHLYEYDKNNREKKYIFPDGGTIINEYDCCAGIQNIDENGNVNSFVRDELSNIVRIVDAMENTTYMTYNGSNMLVRLVDPLGNERIMIYDAVGRLQKSTDPMGSNTSMSFDPEGNVLEIRDARGNTMKYEYDANNQVSKVINSLGYETSVIRDGLGRMKSLINGRGNIISYIYDQDGRIGKKLYDDQEAASYNYLYKDDILRIHDVWGTREISVNKNYQPVKITYPNNQKASFSYTQLGYLETMQYGNGLEVKYYYDKRSRITRVEFNGYFLEYSYDGVGNVLAETRSNGTKTLYKYDAANVLVEVTHKRGEDVFSQFIVERDGLNNIIAEKIISPIELQSLDAEISYKMKCNSFNQLVELNEASLSYDADGNLTASSDGNWKAAYDYDNNMTEFMYGGVKKRFLYDSDGDRVRVTDKKGTRYYNYDTEGRLLFETYENGSILNYCIYGRGRIIAALKEDGAVRFYHFDRSGNTTAITDETGKLEAAYVYEPYGSIVQSLDEAFDNTFTFAGAFGVVDEGNGIYFMKNRYYNAQAGRFLQDDPIGVLGGINLYAYGNGNPLKYVDPHGTNVISTTLFIGSLLTVGYGVYEGVQKLRGTADAVKKANQTVEKHNAALERLKRGDDSPQNLDNARNTYNAYRRNVHQAYVKGGDAAFTNVKNINSILINPPNPYDAIGNAGSLVQAGLEEVINAAGKPGNARSPQPQQPSSAKRRTAADSRPCTPPSSQSNIQKPFEIDWSLLDDGLSDEEASRLLDSLDK